MTTIYDGFNLLDQSTARPWGSKEKQNWMDMADTVTKDTIQGQKDLLGHKHSRLYDSVGNIAVDSNSPASTVQISQSINIPSGKNFMINGVSIGGTGTQGLTGAQGQTGLQGLTGVQGLIGLQGSTGVQGETGLQGSTGVQGETGLQGPTGIQGTQGITGVQGQTGLQGPTGVAGSGTYQHIPVWKDSSTLTDSSILTSYTSSAARTGEPEVTITTDQTNQTLTFDSSYINSGLYFINEYHLSGNQLTSIDFQGSGLNMTGHAIGLSCDVHVNIATKDDVNQVRVINIDATSSGGGTVELVGDNSLVKTLQLADGTVTIKSFGNSASYLDTSHTVSFFADNSLNKMYMKSGSTAGNMDPLEIDTGTLTVGLNAFSKSPKLEFSCDSGGRVHIDTSGDSLQIDSSRIFLDTNAVVIVNIPTDPSGLPSGSLYSSAGIIMITS